MRRASNFSIVICGMVGGCVGYWFGYLAGWSNNAGWSVDVGGFPGTILTQRFVHYLLSIGVAVLFACVAALVVAWLPDWRAQKVLQNGTPATAIVVRVEKTGEQRQVLGRGGVERQLACELEVCPEGGLPYRTRTTQFFTEAARLALQPGAGIVVRYDPANPRRVAIVEPVAS